MPDEAEVKITLVPDEAGRPKLVGQPTSRTMRKNKQSPREQAIAIFRTVLREDMTQTIAANERLRHGLHYERSSTPPRSAAAKLNGLLTIAAIVHGKSKSEIARLLAGKI